MSGKITSIISDHLSQFLIEPANFTKKSSQKIYRQRYYKNFDKFQFKVTSLKLTATVFAMILIQILCLNNFLKSQQNYQISMFLVKISNIQNLNLKPWIKPGWISKINFTKELTKLSPRKKIHTKMKIMKDNSKHTVILYFLIYISNIFLTILITFLQVLLK